jgi:hypothetical protein
LATSKLYKEHELGRILWSSLTSLYLTMILPGGAKEYDNPREVSKVGDKKV